MAVALVQSDGKHVTAVNNTTLAFPSNVTAGNLLLGFHTHFHTGGTTPSLPTDTLGNTWQQSVTLQLNFNIRCRMFWCENSLGGANTVTFDMSGTANGDLTVALAEFSGLLADCDDGSPVTDTATSSTPAVGDKTPSVDDALLVAFLTHGGGNISITEEAGWNVIYEFEDGSSGMPISCVWKQQVGAPVAEDADWTLGSSQLWGGIIHAFKPTVAAGGQPYIKRTEYVPHMALGQTPLRRRY